MRKLPLIIHPVRISVRRDHHLRIKRDPETFAELARLLESLGETQRSSDYYQQALGMAALGLPELPQPKTRV